MTLSRRDLELGRMRDIYVAAVADRALTDEQLSTSLSATLAKKPKGAGWWVFAYGSLLWNPVFPVAEMRTAVLRGRHRRFCLWSLGSRGTPEAPGLVLGLDQGGTCRGVALRLPAPLALDELHLLWRREMVVGSYHPKWVTVSDATGHRFPALAFVVDRKHPQYAGKLDVERQVEVLATACGAFGSSGDYLERTRIALIAHALNDPYLDRLATLVAARCGTPPTVSLTAPPEL
ncbi:MAG: gamma-glutamylcyclotransferase [Casimicrobiaceae bacterium]